MNTILCENPRVIMNPHLPQLIQKYKHYVMRGQEHYFGGKRLVMFDFPYKKFSPKRIGVTKDNISEYYVVDDTTGEVFSMYMLVKCNHCDLCKNSKVNSFVDRCRLETNCYESKPWFATLTYDNDHLPADGLQVRDAQLFLKRLRRNLERSNIENKIRYVLVGEYGKRTHRAHYHAIIWNIPTKTKQEYLDVVSIINKSWQQGYVMCRLINPKDDKGFFYTSKYLKKDCVVPKGMNRTFMLSSRGNGGIGAPFIDSIKETVRRTLNTSYKYYDIWRNKVCELQYSSYVLNRIFPSFCRSVAKEFRDACFDFTLYFRQMSNSLFSVSYAREYDKIKALYGDSVYLCPDGVSIPISCQCGSDTAESFCTHALDVIDHYKNKWYNKDKSTLYTFKWLSDRRAAFLGKLFRTKQPVDIEAAAYIASQRMNYQSPYEVF